MIRIRYFAGVVQPICRRQHFSTDKPSVKRLSDLWDYAKPKLEATQTEVSNSAEKVFTSLKGTVLDMMARRMPSDTREFLANRWGYLSAEPKDAVKIAGDQIVPATARAKGCDAVAYSSSTVESSDAVAYSEVALSAGDTADAHRAPTISPVAADPHPILGKLLCDLSYKRVYVTSVRGLVQAPVWERQRILRPHRSQKIAAAKAKQGGSKAGLPGVITLYMDKVSGRVGIVDGQHRAGALMLMAQNGDWCENEMNILVDVYATDGDAGVSTLFTEINSSEPVKQIDMPDENVSTNVREILTEATDILMNQYKDMFKPSARCRPPHVHADTFRDELYQAEFVSRGDIKTTSELLKKLDSINDLLGSKSETYWTQVNSSKSFTTAYEKAKANNFYLGLTKNWMVE